MNTNSNPEITCPYCGEEFNDSWDYHDDEGEIGCYACGETFDYVREVSVSYSTTKKICLVHDFAPDEYWIRTQRFNQGHWENLISSDYEFYIIKRCKICEDLQHVKISKDEYYKSQGKSI